MEVLNLEVISIAISIVAILGSLTTYLVHEKKLKSQERKINEYQIRKFEAEDAEMKKAFIRANLIKGDRGKRIIKIYNKGKATARNVCFSIVEGDDIENKLFIGHNPFPLQYMNEHDYVDLIIHLHSGSPDQVTIRLTWEDDFKSDNVHSQILIL